MKELRDKKQETLIKSLNEMLFMTSHKVRQPITQILGISNLLNSTSLSQDEIIKIVGWMKDSTQTLDIFTKELTDFMTTLEKKESEKTGNNSK